GLCDPRRANAGFQKEIRDLPRDRRKLHSHPSAARAKFKLPAVRSQSGVKNLSLNRRPDCCLLLTEAAGQTDALRSGQLSFAGDRQTWRRTIEREGASVI